MGRPSRIVCNGKTVKQLLTTPNDQLSPEEIQWKKDYHKKYNDKYRQQKIDQGIEIKPRGRPRKISPDRSPSLPETMRRDDIRDIFLLHSLHEKIDTLLQKATIETN